MENRNIFKIKIEENILKFNKSADNKVDLSDRV